jgi:hypothetical protein
MGTPDAMTIRSEAGNKNLFERLSELQLPPPAILVSLLMACVFLLRLPSARLPRELGVDESQMLSEAMKYVVDPRPWKAVDGGTSGPLNSLFISAFLLLGFKPGYVLLHMLGSLLVCLQVLVAYVTLRRLASEKTATLGAALLVFLCGVNTQLLYLHYNTELLPTLLLMVGFYIFLWLLDDNSGARPGVRLLLLFLAGLVLGAAPWCKLQAAPITAAFGLLLLALIFRNKNAASGWLVHVKGMIALGSGALLPACIILAVVAESGAIKDFWYSDVLNNMAYAGGLSWASCVENLVLGVLFTPVHQLLLVALLGIGLLDCFSPGREVSLLFRKQRWAFSGLAIYAVAGLFASCRVKYFWPKDMFSIPPMTYIAAVLVSLGLTALVKARRSAHPKPSVLFSVLGLLLLGATAALYMAYATRYIKMVHTIHQLSRVQPETTGGVANISGKAPDKTLGDRIADSIGPRNWSLEDYGNDRIVTVIDKIRRTRPVRSLSIWGWSPGVYVLTGIPPATRGAAVFFEINDALPYREYYRARFLGDLRANPPDLFIDTVVRGAIMWPFPPKWTENDGYESDPELRKFIDDNYVLVDELALQPGAKLVRFFARRTTADTLGRNRTQLPRTLVERPEVR